MYQRGFTWIGGVIVVASVFALIGTGCYLRIEKPPILGLRQAVIPSPQSLSAGASPVDPGSAPIGADHSSYREAVKKAAAMCGPDIELVGVSVRNSDGMEIYSFTNGTCESGSGVTRIEVDYNGRTGTTSDPGLHAFGYDTREPINLSEWDITRQQAINAVLARGEQPKDATLLGIQLVRSGGLLVWSVLFRESNGYTDDIRIDAKTGWISSQKRFQIAQ